MSDATPYDDSELFLRISEGDEKAFEQLFDSYLPRIQPVILQIVQSQAAARDLVQDVFLKLWLVRDKLPEIEQPKNYIFRIAYNLAFNYLKRRTVEQKGLMNVMAAASGQENSLEETLDIKEVRRLVEAGIESLPSQTRLIYRLSRTNGYKAQEIADQLGISLQTVRNTISRATHTVKEYLEKEGIVLPVLLITLALRPLA